MFDYSSLEISFMIIVAIIISDGFSLFAPIIKKVKNKIIFFLLCCLFIIFINQIISLTFIKFFMP